MRLLCSHLVAQSALLGRKGPVSFHFQQKALSYGSFVTMLRRHYPEPLTTSFLTMDDIQAFVR